MNRKDFNKEIKNINAMHDINLLTDKTNVLNTVFGDLYITFDMDFKRNCHAIFIRFKNMKKIEFFKEYIKGKYQSFNNHSHKWNIHCSDPENVVSEFEERISNIMYYNV
tara:strand:+ start:157 stop:483 length:327 start_codon:yes stop_codon:yes gene_type:complete